MHVCILSALNCQMPTLISFFPSLFGGCDATLVFFQCEGQLACTISLMCTPRMQEETYGLTPGLDSPCYYMYVQDGVFRMLQRPCQRMFCQSRIWSSKGKMLCSTSIIKDYTLCQKKYLRRNATNLSAEYTWRGTSWKVWSVLYLAPGTVVLMQVR